MIKKKVPNPFWLCDQFLLDRVFNPITWRCEYHYGKDSVHLYSCFLMGGSLLWVISALHNLSYVFLFLILVLTSVWWLRRDVFHRKWVNNNKTGRNIERVNGFLVRMCNLLVLLSVVYPAILLGLPDLYYMVFLGGSFCHLLVCPYLHATDAMPPGYHERKFVFGFI